MRLVLAEKNLDFTMKAEKVWERRPEFLALNPAGEVPVLIEPDGTVLAGTDAIVEYLDEVYREKILIGINPIDRAEVRRLSAWFDQKMNVEVTENLLGEKLLKRHVGQSTPNSQAIRAGHANLPYHLDYIGYLVERRRWLAGDNFSLADITAAAQLSSLDYLGDVPWDAHEAAKEWYARIKSRPTFARSSQTMCPACSRRSTTPISISKPAYFAAAASAGLAAKAGMISRAKRRMFSREPPKLTIMYSTPPARSASILRQISSGVPNSAVSSQMRRTSFSSSRAKRSRSSPSGRRDRLLIRTCPWYRRSSAAARSSFVLGDVHGARHPDLHRVVDPAAGGHVRFELGDEADDVLGKIVLAQQQVVAALGDLAHRALAAGAHPEWRMRTLRASAARR